MSKNRRRMVIVSVALVGAVAVALGTGAAIARSLGHGPFGFHHGPMAFGCHAERLIAELELTPDQQQCLDNVHSILAEHMTDKAGERGEHLSQLIEDIDRGAVDLAEVETAVDSHIEEVRTTARAVAGELVTFANSLDETQRAALVEHLRELEAFVAQHHGPEGLGFWRHQGVGSGS